MTKKKNNCPSLDQRETNEGKKWCLCKNDFYKSMHVCIGCQIDILVRTEFGEYGYGHLKTHTCRETKEGK